MPIYDYKCDGCGYSLEKFAQIYDANPICPECEATMRKVVGSNIMVKIKGEGGYPSRRKQIRNTTSRNHPKLEHELNRVYM